MISDPGAVLLSAPVLWRSSVRGQPEHRHVASHVPGISHMVGEFQEETSLGPFEYSGGRKEEAARLLITLPKMSQNVISTTFCSLGKSLRPAQMYREGE